MPLGARLPRDVDLAERFGVSRPVVRDALDRLRRAGLLEIRRGNGGGAWVRAVTIPTELLTDITELPTAEVAQLLEARRTLETTCALMAAERGSDDDLAGLEELAGRLAEAHHDPATFIEIDARFHLRIARAGGNDALARFLVEVFRELAAVRADYPIGYGSMQAAEAFQHDTAAALRSRSRDRVSASIDRHLGGLEEHFLGRRLAHQ